MSRRRSARNLGDLLLRARAYIDAPPAPADAPARARPPAPSPAEAALLALASEVTAFPVDLAPRPLVAATLERVAAAFTPSSRLAAPPAAGDAERLALAWAREQARLALAHVIERVAKSGALRVQAPVETLAWLLLAAGVELAHEAGDVVGERVAALVDLIVADESDGP